MTSAFLKKSVAAYKKSFSGKAQVRTELELMFVQILVAVSPVLEELLAKHESMNSQDEGFFDVEIIRVLVKYRSIIYGDITATVSRIKMLYKFLDEYVSTVDEFSGDGDFETEADLFSLYLLNAIVPPVQESGSKLLSMLVKKRSTMSIVKTKAKPDYTPVSTKALSPILEDEDIDELADLLLKKVKV